MLRKFAKALTIGGFAGAATVAWACTDVGCAPVWKLGSSESACANWGVLTPGNDSRVNLFQLLSSRSGAEPPITPFAPAGDDYGGAFTDWRSIRAAIVSGEPNDQPDYAGTRCVSLIGGERDFAAALAASGVPAAERSALTAARTNLRAACDKAATGAWPSGIASPAGKEFLAYLQAAEAFYAERFDQAGTGFASLARAGNPWVRETAAYMVARAALNGSQAKAFDEYGWYRGLAKVDQGQVGRGEASLQAYLRGYPTGRYAASATGLLRRALWLRGDGNALAAVYARALDGVAPASPAAVELIQEIDNKLLFSPDRPAAAQGPMLLAALDLVRMRRSVDAAGSVFIGDASPLTAAELDGQAAAFAQAPELYAFLKATHAFHLQNDHRAVLRLIPDDARQREYSPLAFSRQVLRGQALAALNDRNEAGFWRELMGGATAPGQRATVELGLALHHERNGQVAAVFAKDSPVRDTMIRRQLLTHSAGAEVLRSAARDTARPQAERDMALFTLLYKQLTRGDFAGFVSNHALIRADAPTEGWLWEFTAQDQVPVGWFSKGRWSDGFACPAIVATARTLAANPRDDRARLCLGDFLRINGFDGFTALDDKPPAGELGSFARDFPGTAQQRDATYAGIIADPRAAPEIKAYALYRAVMCYAPSGINACGGTTVPVAQRKAWHDRLKRDYPRSPWAQKLRYYW